jgi:hypothetical protein
MIGVGNAARGVIPQMSAVVNKFDMGTPYRKEKIAFAKGTNQPKCDKPGGSKSVQVKGNVMGTGAPVTGSNIYSGGQGFRP